MTYHPRHASDPKSPHARYLADCDTAERAVEVLKAVDTPESRELYARLHRAGVLIPRVQRSVYASRIIAVHFLAVAA